VKPTTYGLVLSETNAARLRDPVPEIDLVLLGRTLFDPPRAAAAARWATRLRRLFPGAELVPYVWHLVTHGPDDGLREHASRTLEGPRHAFGQLQDTPEAARAWDAFAPCITAMAATRLVFRTPASITPGALGRKRITAFVEARRAEGRSLVWEPQGLWTPSEAALFARALDVALLHPAFVGGRPLLDEDDPPRLVAPDAWLRIDPIGRRPQLSADQLDALADHLELAPASTLVFTGPRAIANLRHARTELA
jgi:hypothetical protein